MSDLGISAGSRFNVRVSDPCDTRTITTMDLNALANLIATKVVADTQFWIAVVGAVGVVAGAVLTVAGTLLLHRLQNTPRRELDKTRSALLRRMLDDARFAQRWRKLDTMARVIGADEAETKRLLIELGARGSENDDGLWGLLEHHPLDQAGQ